MFRTSTENASLNVDLTGYQVRPKVEVTRPVATGHGGLNIGHTRAMLLLPLSTLGGSNAGIITEPGIHGTIRLDLSMPALRALRAACDKALAEDIEAAVNRGELYRDRAGKLYDARTHEPVT